VVQVGVQPRDRKDLLKLVEGLKQLTKTASDSCLETMISDAREHVVGASGELYLEFYL
ncbi:hypothetical protein DFH07DRAFT_725699, partial [Mycena maculata]